MRRFALLLLLVLLPVAPAQAEPDSFNLGTGRNGSLTVTTRGSIINTASALQVGAPAGGTELRVASITGLSTAGQLVLIHQSAGLPATTQSGNTGPLTPGALGRWELARVQGSGANRLQLTAPLMHSYSAPGAQVVSVPEYTDVTVQATGELVAPPWNGASGGILAFLASNAVTNNGLISATGAGFRGGAFITHEDLNGCTGLDQSPETGGAYKGEGLVVSRFGMASGRGNLANAGGGGNCHNGGGGGGGHGGFGGTGGRTANVDDNRDMGGLGGALVRFDLREQLEQFVFGGGAGAGEGNNNEGTGGGAGGGAVLIRARTFAGTGLYTADGVTPPNTPDSGDDGAGGGGAGGTVILRAEGTATCGGAHARGGNGGHVSEVDFPLGPGGGGGGGYLLVQGTSVTCPSTVTGGAAGTLAADGGTYGSTFGAGAGGLGIQQALLVSYRTPATPAVTAPESGAVGVSSRPRFKGVADPGVRVFIYIDGVEVTQVGTDTQTGQFSVDYPGLRDPLPQGEHTVTMVAESLAAYSQRSADVTFNVAVSQEDGGVLVAPILVVPVDGEAVGPTPLFAGYAPNGPTVGIEVDNGPEITLTVDAAGRFRYQWPADNPLPPGPHFATVHSHNEAGETGPYSPVVRFETLPDDGQNPDAGSQDPDAGTQEPDAGTNGNPDAGPVPPEVPVMVVPSRGEVVDPTPLFAGVAEPGASVAIEVDDTAVVTVTADTTGAFRYQVPAEGALALGAHRVTAHALVSATQTDGPRSEAIGFEVRGPAALDVGCGCGASPAGVAGVWALLAGLAAAARRRRR